MLAGLAAQSLTVGTTQAAVGFATAAVVFVTLLISSSVAVSFLNAEVLRTVRSTGSTVKRSSGYVLIIVGSWFVLLAALRSPIIGS